MSDLLVPLVAFLVAMVSSEIVLKGSKLQSNVGRIVFLYSMIGIATLSYLIVAHDRGIIAFAIYWTGAFLSWFGFRALYRCG